MRKLCWSVVLASFVACGTETEDTDTAPGPTDEVQSACGEQTFHSVSLTGAVVDVDDVPVAGAEVTLVENIYAPGTTYGTAVTDEDGVFVLSAEALLSIEECWGTLLDYTVVAETSDGRIGEKFVNVYLYAALTEGSYDITNLPVTVE